MVYVVGKNCFFLVLMWQVKMRGKYNTGEHIEGLKKKKEEQCTTVKGGI